MKRLVKLNGTLTDLLGPTAGTLLPSNFQSYAASPYSAYTGMWGVNVLPQNANLQATSSLRVFPATFPKGSVFTWNVTRDPNWAGVEGYLTVAYGNYDNTPGRITPWPVYAITNLSLSVGWTLTGDASSGLLCECWLSPTATPTGPVTKTAEIGFMPRVSATTATYFAGLAQVGSGSFTDHNGVTWNVRVDTSPAQPYFIAYRPGNADFQGVLPFTDLFAFLIGAGKITGNEWFNGVAFGVEPYSGAGTLTVTDFTASYTGAARTPWTVSNLAAAAQSSTSVGLTWTAAPGATSHQYRVNGGAWTDTSAPGAQTVAGLVASTVYTFEVRGVNNVGGGAASNMATATTPAGATASNVIVNGGFNDDSSWSGFWYSGKAVTAGKAVFTSSPAYDPITQNVTLVAGKYYELTWTISSRTSGSAYPSFGGGTGRTGTSRAANGTYTERILANTGNNTFNIALDVTGSLSVDDVSLVGPYNTATVGGA